MLGRQMANRIKPPAIPDAPAWLSGALLKRWDELAPIFTRMGTLSELEAGTLARYIVAENNYLQISNQLQRALANGDGEDAGRWLSAQDKVIRQILTLGETLGLTAEKRKAMGWFLPDA